MMTSSIRLLVVLALIPTAAAAQAPKDAAKTAAPVTVGSRPDRTSASFGDWVMRCESVGSPAKRVCEAAQVMTLQGQTNPVAQVAIGSTEPKGAKQFTLVIPLNVALAMKPQIALAKPGAAPFDLIWQRCTPGGCFASAAVSDNALSAMGAEAEPGRIKFKDAADRDVALPFSFRGLAQALDALAKEPL
jgi:invasion protein IalB